MRTNYCGLISEQYLDQTVTVKGWVHRRRDHGGVIFIDLRDREGIVQVVIDPDTPEAFAAADSSRNEYVLSITGRVRNRPAGTTNDKMISGKIEILAKEIEVLNAAATPPFQIDDENISENVRLTNRVIDLRRPTMQRNLRLRYQVAMGVRRYLDAQGFIDIETPMLTRSTPEGARDYLVPSRVHPGEFFALPQSPQLFKQLLMVAGFDRYYQITKCFRDEDLRADRQPEFTQIVLENLFCHAFGDVHDFVFVQERSFQVDLGEFGLAVGAQVFVAEAFGDLVVAVETGHHQKLLEELRRLRQGEKFARVHAAGHEIIACAFGSGAGEHRGFDIDKALFVEIAAHAHRHLVAQAQVALHYGAAQVDDAVAQAHVFADVFIVDLERRRGGGV